MTQDVVPSDTDLLCENCGYLLNGLPPEGNCPECGIPIAASTTDSGRTLPDWEAGQDDPVRRFQATLWKVVASPHAFFRTLSVRGDEDRSRRFALLLMVPLILFGSKAVILHYYIQFRLSVPPPWLNLTMTIPLVPVFVAAAWFAMYFAVVHLTVIEARYWGFRLHDNVVRRALHYLTPHAVLASLLPLLVITVYLCMLLANENYGLYLAHYLYVLSGSVVVSAIYLFQRYWTAMRAMMRANA